MTNEIDLHFIDRCVDDLGSEPGALIPILQAIQEHYRYLPQEAMERVCELTEITPAALTGVSTFYTQFRHRPVHVFRSYRTAKVSDHLEQWDTDIFSSR